MATKKNDFTKFEKRLNNELWRVIACEVLFKTNEKEYTKDVAKVLLDEMKGLLLSKED